MSYLPSTISGNGAAALLGYSPRRIRALIESGVLQTDGGVTLQSIEGYRGRPVTLEEYGLARAELTRRYNQRRGNLNPQPPDAAARR